jgi:hypothetical protein
MLAAGALDIQAMWVTAEGPGNATTLTFHLEVADLQPSGPLDRFEFTIAFRSDGGDALVLAWRQQGDTDIGAGLWLDASQPCAHTSFSGALPGTLVFDDQADVLSAAFPASCLSGATELGEWALSTSHCLMPPDTPAAVNRCASDSAVDEAGPGRAFPLWVQPLSPEGPGEDVPGEARGTPAAGPMAIGLAIACLAGLSRKR